MSRAFDKVQRNKLAWRALDLSFLPEGLRLSLLSYGWKRRFVDGIVAFDEFYTYLQSPLNPVPSDAA